MVTGYPTKDVQEALKIKEKEKNYTKLNTQEVTKELKELMDQIPETPVIHHIDEFTPRKYVLKRLSRSTAPYEIVEHLVNYYGMKKDEAEGFVKNIRGQLNKQIHLLTKTVAARNVKYLYEIIDECIDNKIYDTAINAIKELNKMSGVTQNQNQVTIAKNQQGEELINITFDS